MTKWILKITNFTNVELDIDVRGYTADDGTVYVNLYCIRRRRYHVQEGDDAEDQEEPEHGEDAPCLELGIYQFKELSDYLEMGENTALREKCYHAIRYLIAYAKSWRQPYFSIVFFNERRGEICYGR